MKKNTKKIIDIGGLKFYKFNDILKKSLKTKISQDAFGEELTRLRLSRQIREMRTNNGMTQKVLAKKAHMPQSVIARMESGTHSFSLGTISKIAKVFNKEVQLV